MALVAKSLDAATAAGSGAAVAFDTPKTDFGVQFNITGSPSTAPVSVKLSIDGVNWVEVATMDVGGLNPAVQLYSFDEQYVFTAVRVDLTALTGGSSPAVTAWVAAPV